MSYRKKTTYHSLLIDLLLRISQYLQENTPVLGSLFKKVAGLKACNFLKRDANTGVFL